MTLLSLAGWVLVADRAEPGREVVPPTEPRSASWAVPADADAAPFADWLATDGAPSGRAARPNERAFLPPPEDHAWSSFAGPTVPSPELATPNHAVVVESGDTFLAILVRAGVDTGEAHAAVAALRDVFDPRRLRVGQALEIDLDPEGGYLERLAFQPSALESIELVRALDAAKGFDARVHETELVVERALAEARVDRSVDDSARRAGVPSESVHHLVNVFKGHVDFRRQTRTGDQLLLWYDQERLPDGRVLRGGDLHYARVHVGGRMLEAFRFEHDGKAEYFDRSGQSLRRLLLRQPVTGYRISSGFGMRRHPILGYQRMHNGIDFAAPTGTPIHAAGSGRLVRVGRHGGYGNYIRIDHGNGYETAYAHLSRFARGIASGRRVQQGDLIGYVGSTGVSTGPHLHFEVIRNGRHVNPLTVAQPPATQLAGERLQRFQRHVAAVDASIERERERVLVMDTSRRTDRGRGG